MEPQVKLLLNAQNVLQFSWRFLDFFHTWLVDIVYILNLPEKEGNSPELFWGLMKRHCVCFDK